MTTIRRTALLTVAALCTTTPMVAAAAVDSGTVVPFRGIAGANLGMTRSAVIGVLGRPLHENGFGVMSYSDAHIMDVYRASRRPAARVRMVIASGPGFCATGVPKACSFATGSVTAMLRAYPGRFRRVVDGTGDTVYWWCGRARGRHISTSFNVDAKRRAILTWYLVDQGSRCPTLAEIRSGGG